MIAWSTDAPDWKAIFSTRTQVSWNVARTVSRVDPPVVTCTVRGLLPASAQFRSEEHTSELQSQSNIVCRLLLEKKKITLYVYILIPISKPQTPTIHRNTRRRHSA